MSISEIKPVGNFKEILEGLDDWLCELEEKNKYSNRVATFIKTVVNELGLIDALSKFNEPYTGWNYEEQKMCLLYTYILIIRANNIAQKYLNNIEMDEIHVQLNDYMKTKPELHKIFNNVIFEE